MDIENCTEQLMELENELAMRDYHSKDIFINGLIHKTIKFLQKLLKF